MLSANMRGGLCMMGAMAAFTLNDSIIKLLSGSIPLPQIILFRGVITLALIAALFSITKTALRLDLMKRPVIWWRALTDLGATYAFLTALKYIPIANAVAILSVLPLAVTLGGALFLGKPVGWRRLSAILVGLVGVILIVKPGMEGFSVYSLLVLVCVLFSASRDLITHQASADIPSSLFVLSGTLMITVSGLFYPLTGGAFTSVDFSSVLWMSVAAALVLSAYYFVTAAMRQGEISFVTPFRYTSLLWATAIGFFVFGDQPDMLTIIGSAIVVATGLYTIYRERIVSESEGPIPPLHETANHEKP